MPREFSRTRRIGEQIRRELAQLIRDQIQDPRLVMVSITGVAVTRDLANAKIYVTFLGDPSQRTAIVDSLNQAASMLRYELGHRMYIRTVPRLQFVYDDMVERGARLSALIAKAVATDVARHRDDGADDEKL
jgi:ribosome-binding factor A